MTELYRFRKVENLFGNFKELEKQSIYFASPEELNDPMEDVREIFWQGDQIVWRNFFKQYIYCLLTFIINAKFLGSEITRDKLESMIRVAERRDEFCREGTYSQPKNICSMLSEIYNRVFNKNELDKFTIEIGKLKRKVRTAEVLVYLQVTHLVVLTVIDELFVDLGIHSSIKQPLDQNYSKSIVKDLFKLIQSNDDVTTLDEMFAAANQILAGFIILGRNCYRSKIQISSEAKQNSSKVELIIFDFPNSYLKQLVKQLVYPKWYTSCFTRNCQNASVWGHYADGHRGVCLIFEVNKSEEANMHTISLNEITSLNQESGCDNIRENRSKVQIPIYEINYLDKVDEIDFFRSIGNLPGPILKKFWYSNEEGKFSKCGSHLINDNADAWKKNYWNHFLRDITVKTSDWKYEQESRLILHRTIGDLSQKRRRTLTYDFSSLKGIVFGIQTSNDDKNKIYQTILKKCVENSRANFEFFQAYFNQETADIQRRKLYCL